jgi:hypothetical protein
LKDGGSIDCYAVIGSVKPDYTSMLELSEQEEREVPINRLNQIALYLASREEGNLIFGTWNKELVFF